MSYTALAYSVFMMPMDAKIMPTDDTNYSCHIKAIELIQPIIWGLYHTTSYK